MCQHLFSFRRLFTLTLSISMAMMATSTIACQGCNTSQMLILSIYTILIAIGGRARHMVFFQYVLFKACLLFLPAFPFYTSLFLDFLILSLLPYQIRDIAATPYGVPMLINEAPQLPKSNEALPHDAIVNEVLINEAPQLPEPNEPLPDDAIYNEVLINEAPQLP